VERLFAWLNAYKRTLVRWDRCHEKFTAFVQSASAMMLSKRIVAFMK
jgi:transposase